MQQQKHCKIITSDSRGEESDDWYSRPVAGLYPLSTSGESDYHVDNKKYIACYRQPYLLVDTCYNRSIDSVASSTSCTFKRILQNWVSSKDTHIPSASWCVCDTAEEVRRHELSLRNTSARYWTNTRVMTQSDGAHECLLLCLVPVSLREREFEAKRNTEKRHLCLDFLDLFLSKTFGTFALVAWITSPSV